MLLPAEGFPAAPEGAVQSFEPADTETPLRRAYFVNMTRDDVMAHYKKEFDSLPILRLNYPPEEAQSIIRDQTRSSYLEELVHPFRESVYVNGFMPKEEKDVILINGIIYDQKITIRYVPSSVIVRVLYTLAVSVLFYILIFKLLSLATSVVKHFYLLIFKK